VSGSRSAVNKDKIYLVGFVSAGKTSLAIALGQRLGWLAVDIDEFIETRERRSVAAIFADEGEPFFRAAERSALYTLLPMRNAVVATGAGTFADPESRALINQDGTSIWLDVPLSELVNRLPTDRQRPLAADRSQMERVYHLRRLAYEQAHLRIDASHTAVEELAERVLDWLGY
jgi:shikimate kinase